MKELLKEYLTALREEEALKSKKKELLKQLFHVKDYNGKELGDIVFKNRSIVRELIIENMPEDASDDELYMKSHSICDELYFMEYHNHPDLISQDNARFGCGGYFDGMSAAEAKAYQERTM